MAVMLTMFMDAIYEGVISNSMPGMKSQGGSTAATSAAWLPELIEVLDNIAALPAPCQSEIDACHARLSLRTGPVQATLH
jgi:hypothetical protein